MELRLQAKQMAAESIDLDSSDNTCCPAGASGYIPIGEMFAKLQNIELLI